MFQLIMHVPPDMTSSGLDLAGAVPAPAPCDLADESCKTPGLDMLTWKRTCFFWDVELEKTWKKQLICNLLWFIHVRLETLSSVGQRLPFCIKTEKHESALAELVTVCSELGSPLSSYFYLFLLFLKIVGLAFSKNKKCYRHSKWGPKPKAILAAAR